MRRKRKLVLSDVGVTRFAHLTPKKQKLFKDVKRYERINSFLKRTLKSRKSLFGKRDSKFLLANPKFRLLENLTPTAKTFILSQLKHAGNKKKLVKWTSEEKALYLALYKSAPRGYRFLEKIMKLPSKRTLQRTLNSVTINPGISDHIFNYLAAVSVEMKPLHRYCVLMFDEVYLQPHLNINMQYKCIDGLENLGDGCSNNIADHALVFMLQGINQKWKQPVSYYFVRSGVKTIKLKSILKDIISAIHEKTKFCVLATVSDQGSANVAAISALSVESGFGRDCIFKIGNHKIYHIFDPPHLVKCFRNNFLQKNIHFDKHVAKWSDLQALYDLDGSNPDSKICKKLTENHIRPEGRLKMKVKLATQIFSRDVYAALTFAEKCGIMQCEGTRELVLFMDQLFDSLNSVRNSTKPLKRTLTDNSQHIHFWGTAKPFLSKLRFF